MEAATVRKIGIIHSKDCVTAYELDHSSRLNGYEVGHVYSPNSLYSRYTNMYPAAQRAQTPLDIASDESLELILIFQEERQPKDVLESLLQSGKPVRIL